MPGQMSIDLDGILEHRNMLLTVAYGAGSDSTAMLVEMIKRGIRPDLITFADTGSEMPYTYAFLEHMNAYLVRHNFPPITIVRYVLQRPKHGPYSTLAGNCLVNQTLPSLAYGGKSCSLKWKAAPQENYILKHWEPGIKAQQAGQPIRRFIGYDAGIKDHRRGAIKECDQFWYGYPLRYWGYDREDCINIIANAGLPQPGKSACFFCPSTKPHELIDLAKQYPDLAARAVAIERRAQPNLKAIDGLWRNGTKTKPGKWETFLTQQGLMPKIQDHHYEEVTPDLPAKTHMQSFRGLQIRHIITQDKTCSNSAAATVTPFTV